jgi:hypothetical protein
MTCFKSGGDSPTLGVEQQVTLESSAGFCVCTRSMRQQGLDRAGFGHVLQLAAHHACQQSGALVYGKHRTYSGALAG